MKAFFLTCVALAFAASPGKVFYSKDQAMALAFGKKTAVAQSVHYWTEEERNRLIKLAGSKKVGLTHIEYSKLVPDGKQDDGRRVWFDTHLVRTKKQTVMVVVNKDGVVENLVVCRFDEPRDYKPVDRWYAQFHGKKLDKNLKLKKAIHGVSGATLTARATTAAVREVLAAHQIAHPPASVKTKTSIRKRSKP